MFRVESDVECLPQPKSAESIAVAALNFQNCTFVYEGLHNVFRVHISLLVAVVGGGDRERWKSRLRAEERMF